MQRVAPKGFRVQLDFNANAEYRDISPILKERARFPVIGRIEDPIQTGDRDGYRKLIAESDIELLIHHGPVDYLIDKACDGYMAGHAPIGHAIKVAGVSEESGLPFMLQQAGGQINQAFLAHEVAVFSGAKIDHVNLAHLWVDDVTTTRARVTRGTIAVPKGPGLGMQFGSRKTRKVRDGAASAVPAVPGENCLQGRSDDRRSSRTAPLGPDRQPEIPGAVVEGKGSQKQDPRSDSGISQRGDVRVPGPKELRRFRSPVEGDRARCGGDRWFRLRRIPDAVTVCPTGPTGRCGFRAVP
ncbi:MAG: hypothetical protein CM1200mP2_43760 [Planctomycetaceae bacterium]|nr:MAG: hypothetical protein CM1200mP2_43760 [Planctomycetaceae bacterium]